MADLLNNTFYGLVAEADEYFSHRLHEWAWTSASSNDKTNSLITARRLIDGLAFKGDKHVVWALMQSNPVASIEEIQAAEATQPNEFPRGADTTVPEDIRVAQYELAHALLDNKDPELELEVLAVTGQTCGNVKTTYERGQVPLEHLINMIPSPTAWRLIRPFLRDSVSVKFSRAS